MFAREICNILVLYFSVIFYLVIWADCIASCASNDIIGITSAYGFLYHFSEIIFYWNNVLGVYG